MARAALARRLRVSMAAHCDIIHTHKEQGKAPAATMGPLTAATLPTVALLGVPTVRRSQSPCCPGRTDYVADGQPSQQGTAGGSYDGRSVNGGNDLLAGMDVNPQNVPLPHDDQYDHRFMGYGHTSSQYGFLSSLVTVVEPRPPVHVPTQQQQQLNTPLQAGGYPANARAQNQAQNPTAAANGQPGVNGSNAPYANTHGYPTQAPRQAYPRSSRPEDYYRRQQGPSSRGDRRSGN